MAKTLTLPLMLLSLLLPAGCKHSRRTQPAPPQRRQPVSAPAELLAYGGVRDLGSTVRKVLDLLGQELGVRLDRTSLAQLVLTQARLPAAVVDALDLRRPAWLVLLDGTSLREYRPSLVALPIRSKRAMQTALATQLEPEEQQGPLTVYRPTAHAPQLIGVQVWFGQRYALVPSSRKAFEIGRAFVQTNLLDRPLRNDLELHLLHERQHGQLDLTRQLEQTLANFGRRAPATTKAGGGVEPVIQRLLTYAAQLLASTRHLRLAADLSTLPSSSTPPVITLTLSADGHDGGMLQQLVKSCRGSLSTAYRWLPRQSWLVIGERAATHSGTTSGATAALLQAGLPELVTLPAKKVLSRFLGQTLPALTRDYALALHAPASGGGIALTLVAHVSDPQATTRQLQRAADRLQHWAVANREGRLFALPLARTPDAKEAYVRAIWGADLALGWSVVGSTALLCVGKGAAERLQQLSRQLAAGTAPANALSSHPAFKQVLAQAGRRSGLLYVVPEGLLQALQKTGIPELEQLQTPPSASSAQGATTETPTTSAPYLLWGAAADGETYEVTLYLPIAPLSRFQDALRALAQGTTAARSSSTTKRFRR